MEQFLRVLVLSRIWAWPRARLGGAHHGSYLFVLIEKAGEGSVAVDAGANVGIFTAAFAAAGFSEVHAFEPVPATFARLAENVAFNHFGSCVKLNALGLGDQERTAEMQYDQKSPATAHIVAGATPGACPIKITTLDRYAELSQIHRIDFLKIDTEGHETAVLRGAAKLLREKRVSLILLEWCPELLFRAGSGPDELWQTIMNAGYAMRTLTSAGKTGPPLTCDELKSMPWANLIAVAA